MLVRGANNRGDILLALREHHAVGGMLDDAVSQQPQIPETFAGGVDESRLFVAGNLTFVDRAPDLAKNGSFLFCPGRSMSSNATGRVHSISPILSSRSK